MGLTNIASTNMTSVIVDMGAVPHLVALLDSASDVREQLLGPGVMSLEMALSTVMKC